MLQNQNDILERLKEHRQRLNAWRQQQVAFEERLQLLRQRQQELQEHLKILRGERQYLEMLKQMKSQKRLERPLAKLIRL